MASEPPVTVPIQVIDPTFGSAPPPAPCNSSLFSLSTFGLNGILGVAPFQFDSSFVSYFTCQTGSCAGISIPPSQAVQNPVYLLPQDNNGVFISLPGVPNGGAPTSSGNLIFGVATSPANDPRTVSSGKPYVTFSASSFQFITTYKGSQLESSLVDTGSNMLFFYDTSLTQCSLGLLGAELYCPATPIELSATLSGDYGTSQTLAFQVADGKGLLSSANSAFSNLAAPVFGIINSFDWGLPFFYNRVVFIGYGKTSFGPPPMWGYAYISQPYDGLLVNVTTGKDDAGDGTEITARLSVQGQVVDMCLKPSTSTGPWYDPVCNGSGATHSWAKWQSTPPMQFSTVFAQAVAGGSGTIDLKLSQHSCQTFCDNWDIQAISVKLTDSTSNSAPMTVLDMWNPHQGDNCIARLKASPNATTVRFSLDGTNSHVYVDGTSAEQGQTTTCKNNGDNG
jgi:hypothetical protein